MNTCPLTLALEVKDNGLSPLDNGYLHVVMVTRGAVSLSSRPGTLVVPAGSLWAAPGPWTVTSTAEASRWLVLGFHPSVVNDGWAEMPPDGEVLGQAASMDYWLIEPLVDAPPLVLSLSPEVFPSMVRSIQESRQTMETKASPFWRCFARGHLFDFLQDLRRCLEAGTAQAAVRPSPTAPWVAERLVYLHAALAQKPTLAQAARQAGMNRDAFSRRIKAETGHTFHELLTDLRLRKAEWLVRQTLLPLARVAEEVGLRDQTHFTRLFKAHYAAAPSRYRVTQGQKAESS